MSYGPVFHFDVHLALPALKQLMIPWSCLSAWPRLIKIVARQHIWLVCPLDTAWINPRLNDEVKYEATVNVLSMLETGTIEFRTRTPIQAADLRKWVKPSLPDSTERQCQIAQLRDRYAP